MEHQSSLEVQVERELEAFMLRYADNPAVRTLLQLIPGLGGAVDTALTLSIVRLRKERLQEYFEEMASRIDRETAARLAAELPGNEELIHAHLITTRAALDTRRREKIRLFARLFANYVKGESVATAEVYEEMLAVLDDLSYREFQVLLILQRFESRTSSMTGLDETPPSFQIDRGMEFWEDFFRTIEAELSIPNPEITGLLARLARTGLYQSLAAHAAGYPGSLGYLTPNFTTFLKALGEA
jgi:hypothetical protein